MTHGFQQQDTFLGHTVTRAAPSPQHGQKAGPKSGKPEKPRPVTPRPGH